METVWVPKARFQVSLGFQGILPWRQFRNFDAQGCHNKATETVVRIRIIFCKCVNEGLLVKKYHKKIKQMSKLAKMMYNLLRWMVPVSGRGKSGDDRARHARVCPRDLKYRENKTNMAARRFFHTRLFFSCLSEIGSKRKMSFGCQLLNNSVCIRKTLSVTQYPKFKAKVSISVAINPVGDRDRNNLKTSGKFCQILVP